MFINLSKPEQGLYAALTDISKAVHYSLGTLLSGKAVSSQLTTYFIPFAHDTDKLCCLVV